MNSYCREMNYGEYPIKLRLRGDAMLIKSEIYKLIKLKASFLPLFLAIGAIVCSMLIYGSFGYSISSRMIRTFNLDMGMIAYSEKDGEPLSGQEGYALNKEVATRYRGEVNDSFLAQLHLDFNASSYLEDANGERFNNATYAFFRDVFNIASENYAKRDDIWGDVAGSIQYGFSGDWDAYGNILHNFFLSFSLFVIVFVAPLFTYDRECNMTAILDTAKNGGRQLFKEKAWTAFLAVNILMLTLLMVISVIHFSRYGFANANVSIQCSLEKKFVDAAVNCTMGQLTVWRILFGASSCNIVLLVTMLVSMLNRTTLSAFVISIAVTWPLSYPIVQLVANSYISNLLLFVAPVNGLFMTVVLREASSWHIFLGIFTVRLVLFVLLFFITGKIWEEHFLALNRQGD